MLQVQEGHQQEEVRGKGHPSLVKLVEKVFVIRRALAKGLVRPVDKHASYQEVPLLFDPLYDPGTELIGPRAYSANLPTKRVHSCN